MKKAVRSIICQLLGRKYQKYWDLSGLILAISLGLGFGRVPQSISSIKKPLNILFIVVDDLRTNLGCYGDSLAYTPNIDQLANRGVLFNRAYCQQAVCAPSRASMLTGLRPDSTRIWDLNTPVRTYLPAVMTLPQHFKQQGYLTQCIGKIFHDPADHQDPLSWSVPAQLNVTDEAGGKYVLPENSRNGGKRFWKAAPTERADVPDSAYIDGGVAQAAVQALAQYRGRPFFLAVGFRRPHLPFSAPGRYWQHYRPAQFANRPIEALPVGSPAYAGHQSTELRGYTGIPPKGELDEALKRQLLHGYYASTSFVDAQIGLVLQKIKQLGLTENTIVVLVSDHGFHLGEQGLWTKTSNYELDLRVPLVVACPGFKGKGRKTNALVELIDLYPTLTALCGLTSPKQTQGKSFKQVLDQPNQLHRQVAISQFPRPWPYKKHPDLIGYSIRTDRYRYTEWRRWADGTTQGRELFDLAKEPIEQINVVDQPSFAKIAQELTSELAALIPRQAASLQQPVR